MGERDTQESLPGATPGATPETSAGMTQDSAPAATRSQHVVLHGPADLRMITTALRPGVERSREARGVAAPVCLVVTPTIEQALSAAEQARLLLANEQSRVVPVSAVTRARRILAAGAVSVATGTAADLLALRRDAAIDLRQLQTIVIIGLDEILSDGGVDTLQALLGDAPAEVMRVATLDESTAAVEAFLEAQMRRARVMTPRLAGDTPLSLAPSFVITSASGRADALRGIVDEVDPPSLVVVASSDTGEQGARAALVRMGMLINGSAVQVVRQPTSEHVTLVVFWEAPASYDALADALATRPVDAVALLLPDELPAFRRMTHGLAEAWTPAPRKATAESRAQALRTALQTTLASSGGTSASEMALLAPMLETHDALEIAAAALRLYEGARRDVLTVRARAAFQAPARTPVSAPRELSLSAGGASGPAGGAGKLRVFLAVGKRDGARVGDIVGAVANEAGIPSDRIGAVEMFESHTTVQLSPEDAAQTVTALVQSSMRGRRLSARIDERSHEQPKERRSFGPPRADRAPRNDRPARSFDRDERGPSRGPSRGPVGADRGPRADDRGGPSRGGGRPLRPDEERRAFGDRPVAERAEGRAEWSERAERMQHAKRTPRPPTDQNDEA